MNPSRRSVLRHSCGALLCLPACLAKASDLPALETRALSFHNLHTGEALKTVYWETGDYVPGALKEIDRILRDHRNGEIHPIAPKLLDTLSALSRKLESTKPFEIISGYRSPATNARLRKEGHKVAEHSLHMDGIAIDIRVADRTIANLRNAAISLKAGGVGYYPQDRFVHVDIGRVRTW